MWTLINNFLLETKTDHNHVSIYMKNNALKRISEQNAWRRRFSLARFSNFDTFVLPSMAVDIIDSEIELKNDLNKIEKGWSDMEKELETDTKLNKDFKLNYGQVKSDKSCLDNLTEDDEWSIL